MKKVLCLVFTLISFNSVYCYDSLSRLNSSTESRQKNDTETFGHLKRRYPRKYNFKKNLDRLERDDFGYAPFSLKKSYN